MKKSLLIFSFILFSALAVLVLKPKNQPKTVNNVLSATDKKTYPSQSRTFGAVKVEAKPEQLISNQDVIINLSLNTHSVDLDYDYLKIAKLTDDLGNSYSAKTWNGGNSGHHLNGDLTFEPLSSTANSVTLTLSGIDDQTKNFTWKILP